MKCGILVFEIDVNISEFQACLEIQKKVCSEPDVVEGSSKQSSYEVQNVGFETSLHFTAARSTLTPTQHQQQCKSGRYSVATDTSHVQIYRSDTSESVCHRIPDKNQSLFSSCTVVDTHPSMALEMGFFKIKSRKFLCTHDLI